MASSLHSSCILPSPRSLPLSSPRTSLPCSCRHPPPFPSPHQHLHPLLSHANSLSSLSIASGVSSLSALLPPSSSRFSRRANARSAAVIRAAFIFEWITRVFKFVAETPIKLFAEKLEADLNKAAKLLKTGATVVVHIAQETNEFASEVSKFSEQVEQFAEKVEIESETIREKVTDVLDVIEGEKKVVVTGYKFVETEEITTAAVASTDSGNQPTVTVETVIKESSTEKSINP